jgi:hypothetical protein
VGDLLRAFGPIMAFMLLPLWIPLIAVAGGALRDRFGSDRAKDA